MKKLFYILIFSISSLLLFSCEKEPLTNGGAPYYPIFNGYMQFSTEVSTRAQLATSMRGRDFGVIGYQFSSTTDWGAAKPLSSPSTFYNQKISCAAATGICTYDVDNTKDGDQFKQWEDNHYAFFAYYPYNGNGITLSSATATNTPTLTYTYPWINKNTVPVYDESMDSQMYDLMTAEDIDCDGSDNVKFDFKHRLFALEVLANNYNETVFEYVYDTTKPVYKYEVDENGNPVFATDENGNKIQDTNPDGTPKYEIMRDENGNYVYATDENSEREDKRIVIKPAATSISDLSITISGLQYESMTIPLSMREGEPEFISRYHNTSNPIGSKKFDIQDVDVSIPAFNDPIYDDHGNIIAGNGIATSISKMGTSNHKGYLMFIPQEEPLEFELLWKEIDAAQGIDRKITSTVQFEAGYLYQLVVNFVGSGITIHLIRAGAWDEEKVYHTFE